MQHWRGMQPVHAPLMAGPAACLPRRLRLGTAASCSKHAPAVLQTRVCARRHYMAAAGHRFEPIWERIEDLVVLSLLAIVPQLRYQYCMARPAGDPHSVCFELLGYDILIDELKRCARPLASPDAQLCAAG